MHEKHGTVGRWVDKIMAASTGKVVGFIDAKPREGDDKRRLIALFLNGPESPANAQLLCSAPLIISTLFERVKESMEREDAIRAHLRCPITTDKEARKIVLRLLERTEKEHA